MYVIAHITLDGPDGEEEYEVGAEVDYECEYRRGGVYEVGEPEISAPDCTLKCSRLVDPDTLPLGWSTVAEEALIEAYCDKCNDAADAAADYEYDRQRDEEYDT